MPAAARAAARKATDALCGVWTFSLAGSMGLWARIAAERPDVPAGTGVPSGFTCMTGHPPIPPPLMPPVHTGWLVRAQTHAGGFCTDRRMLCGHGSRGPGGNARAGGHNGRAVDVDMHDRAAAHAAAAAAERAHRGECICGSEITCRREDRGRATCQCKKEKRKRGKKL